jgi:hypothetical protein
MQTYGQCTACVIIDDYNGIFMAYNIYVEFYVLTASITTFYPLYLKVNGINRVTFHGRTEFSQQQKINRKHTHT